MRTFDAWLSSVTGAPMGSARLTLIILITMLIGQASCAFVQSSVAATNDAADSAARMERYNKRNAATDAQLKVFRRTLCAIALKEHIETGADCERP